MLARVTHEVVFVARRQGRAVELRSEARDGSTLLDAALACALPVARACGGGALCARCGFELLAGAASLSPEDDVERVAKRRNRVPAAWRLSCQARIHGPLRATTGYW
jgi:ferredoxin